MNASLSLIPSAKTDHDDRAPDSGTRVTLAAEALALLILEKQIADLKARAEPLRVALLARMSATGHTSVTVPGAGSISYVSASTRTSVDAKAAEAALVALDQPVPVTSSNVKASLRVNCNR